MHSPADHVAVLRPCGLIAFPGPCRHVTGNLASRFDPSVSWGRISPFEADFSLDLKTIIQGLSKRFTRRTTTRIVIIDGGPRLAAELEPAASMLPLFSHPMKITHATIRMAPKPAVQTSVLKTGTPKEQTM